jgi:hypothetical protein
MGRSTTDAGKHDGEHDGERGGIAATHKDPRRREGGRSGLSPILRPLPPLPRFVETRVNN